MMPRSSCTFWRLRRLQRVWVEVGVGVTVMCFYVTSWHKGFCAYGSVGEGEGIDATSSAAGREGHYAAADSDAVGRLGRRDSGAKNV